MQFEWRNNRREVTVAAPAKLNLYLEILGRRADGFHEIDTLMQAISLADEIDFRSRPAGTTLDTFAVAPGPGLTPDDVPPASTDNLVLRAVRMMREEAVRRGCRPELEGLDITLRKCVPMGAGLGGGSSDAAATLLALDRLWGLDLDGETLEGFAAELGSDVAFFLYGGMARCLGRGEIVRPVVAASSEPTAELPSDESNSGGTFYYAVVVPPVHVSTSLIYKSLSLPVGDGKGLTTPEPLLTMNLSSIHAALRSGELIRNRLQDVAFRCFPVLGEVYGVLCEEGFGAVQLTGSGAAIFGTCENAEQARTKVRKIRSRFESRFREGAETLPGSVHAESWHVFEVSSVPRWSS